MDIGWSVSVLFSLHLYIIHTSYIQTYKHKHLHMYRHTYGSLHILSALDYFCISVVPFLLLILQCVPYLHVCMIYTIQSTCTHIHAHIPSANICFKNTTTSPLPSVQMSIAQHNNRSIRSNTNTINPPAE